MIVSGGGVPIGTPLFYAPFIWISMLFVVNLRIISNSIDNALRFDKKTQKFEVSYMRPCIQETFDAVCHILIILFSFDRSKLTDYQKGR